MARQLLLRRAAYLSALRNRQQSQAGTLPRRGQFSPNALNAAPRTGVTTKPIASSNSRSRKSSVRRRKSVKNSSANRAKRKPRSAAVIAQSQLRLAKQLLNAGRTDAARKRLQKLIRAYPETPAANEAKQLLKAKAE